MRTRVLGRQSMLKFLPLLILLTAVATSTKAQSVSLDPTQPFRGTVDNVKTQLESVINTLGSETRQSIFVAGQQALLAIQNLQYTADYSSNKLVKDITDTSEKTVLNDSLLVVQEIKGGIGEQTKALDVSTQRIENAVSRLPLADRSPRVIDYSPHYIASISKEPLKNSPTRVLFG